jgi:hypothetical protein
MSQRLQQVSAECRFTSAKIAMQKNNSTCTTTLRQLTGELTGRLFIVEFNLTGKSGHRQFGLKNSNGGLMLPKSATQHYRDRAATATL